jgi:hypothetical protein
MTFAEISVFDVMILEANWKREPVGLCKITMEQLRSKFGCGINTLRRAVRGLEEMKYIERVDGGWIVLNMNGEAPVIHPARMVFRSQDAERRWGSETDPYRGALGDPKRIDQGSETDHQGDPKRIDQGSETDPSTLLNPQKRADLQAPKKGKNVRRKKGKKGETPRPPLVYWLPAPVWEENHPSHVDALLRVGDEHLAMLVRDYPTISVRDEIVNLKNKALTHTKKYGATRNWQARLTNWLKNAVVFEAERNGGSRATRSQSPAAEELATEQAWEVARPDNAAAIAAAIAACEKEHGPHAGRLTQREHYAFCEYGCGKREDKS